MVVGPVGRGGAEELQDAVLVGLEALERPLRPLRLESGDPRWRLQK